MSFFRGLSFLGGIIGMVSLIVIMITNVPFNTTIFVLGVFTILNIIHCLSQD